MHGEDAEHLEVYAASADAIAIVGNTEFAFHTQVVAGHSKVSLRGCGSDAAAMI